jgi:hypothetical protein
MSVHALDRRICVAPMMDERILKLWTANPHASAEELLAKLAGIGPNDEKK